jgi:flagellar biosynthesis chaperone FliJ
MAQFHFALDKILRWRATELAAEEAKLQRLIQERARIEAMLSRVATERSGLAGSVAILPDLRGADFRAMAAYGLRLRQHVEKIQEARTRVENGLAAQQKKYALAKLRLRLLEQLKERRLQRWKYEEARQVETLAAESYLSGWNRDEIAPSD